jgi:phosphoribosyl-ATP pyrophosphohydrolase / phosphoribosyl-AMP cyclohydrolase / histidinol dehydrogenase
MPAGPSELLVICDSNSNKAYVVSDLLSQAEHGPDSQVVLVTVGMNEKEIEQLQQELKSQSAVLPRSDIVKVALSKSYILSMDTIDEALNFSNKYAPEHLILNVDGAEELVPQILNSGSVFVGAYSPER